MIGKGTTGTPRSSGLEFEVLESNRGSSIKVRLGNGVIEWVAEVDLRNEAKELREVQE